MSEKTPLMESYETIMNQIGCASIQRYTDMILTQQKIYAALIKLHNSAVMDGYEIGFREGVEITLDL